MRKSHLVFAALLGNAVLFAACSSGNTTALTDAGEPPSQDAAVEPSDSALVNDAPPTNDAVAPDAGSDSAVDAALTCDKALQGPFVTIFPSGGSVVGATVSYDGCSSSTTASGPSYALSVSTTSSVLRAKLAGFHTSLTAELNPVVLALPQLPPIPLQIVDDSQLQGYDAAKAHVLLTVNAAGNGCSKDGNTVTIPGHPEAVIKYLNNDGSDSGSAATINAGIAWVTNLTPGAAVKPVVSAAGGCKVNSTFTTGNVRLEADTVSVWGFQLDP